MHKIIYKDVFIQQQGKHERQQTVNIQNMDEFPALG